MSSLRWLVALAFAGSVACTSVEQGIPVPTGGSGSDAGTGTDAGGRPADAGGGPADAGGGPADAGTTPDAGISGSADAGTGGSTDAGTIVNDCNGLPPATLGTMRSYSAAYDSRATACGEASGSGSGIVALNYSNVPHPAWAMIGPAGESKGTSTLWRGTIWPQPGDFLSVEGGANPDVFVGRWSDRGISNANRTQFEAGSAWIAVDFRGGIAIAGNIGAAGAGGQWPIQLMAVNEDATLRFGVRRLPSQGAVFGLGVDLNERILVIQDCGRGCIAAQWYQRDGTPATDVFKLVEGFQPGPATWFETAPLIGGGLAVRRVDARASGQLRGFTSAWLWTVDSGSTSVHAPPAWLSARNNTNLALARGGAAYAVLANGADGDRCTQKLELVSPSGNSCASWDLAMANDVTTCDNWDLRLGLDGTVLQHLPAQLEQSLDSDGRTKSCTVRFWPAALK